MDQKDIEALAEIFGQNIIVLETEEDCDRAFGQLEQSLLYDRYEIYKAQADDGKGGDTTRPGMPLKTYQEWLDS